MNKYKFYKPDFDTEEGRKIFYAKVWGLIKYIFILLALFFVLLFVTLGVASSNLQESESAHAEVSSLATNTLYDLQIPMTGFSTLPYNTSPALVWYCNGSLTINNSTFAFTQIFFESGTNANRDNTRLGFYDNNSHYYMIRYRYNGNTGFTYTNNGAGLSTSPTFAQLNFTSLGSYTGNYNLYNSVVNLFKSNLSIPIVAPDSPVLVPAGDFSISIIGKYFNVGMNQAEWYTNNNYFVMLKCDFADSFYNSDYHGVLLRLRMYDGAENLVFDEEIVGYMDTPNDQYAYFIVLIPNYSPEIGPLNISKFESHLPGDTTHIVTYSLLENVDTFNAIVSSMDAVTEFTIDTGDLYYRRGYSLGFQSGQETDKTLLSVMWQTFNLPFRLLFGTYDDVQSSPTYGHYVGGLFNFTILGVDIRAFCIGIMSFAIVLAVVRFVIGVKG